MESRNAATMERRGRREHEDQNPWFGEPPNLETAIEWRDVITAEIAKIQGDLADANNSMPIFHDDGTPVTPVDFPVWKRGKLQKRDARVNRQHYLKRWIADHDTSGLTPAQQRAIAKDQTVEVHAMFAAARRFELLDGLHQACRRLAQDDDEAGQNWNAMIDALNVLDQHGAQEPAADQ